MAKQRSKDVVLPLPTHPDAAEFRAAVRDVKPLTHEVRQTGVAAPRKRLRPGKTGAAGFLDAEMPLVAAPAGEYGADLGGTAALAFQRAGVQNQVMRRLRRGLFPIEDELDLHGLTQLAAREQLAHFLDSNRAAGRRCVRIIHGKGLRSGGRGPILKLAVDSWLRRHLDVMAFISARPIDGGTGAVCVLLRA